jgi:hypothetical protein
VWDGGKFVPAGVFKLAGGGAQTSVKKVASQLLKQYVILVVKD